MSSRQQLIVHVFIALFTISIIAVAASMMNSAHIVSQTLRYEIGYGAGSSMRSNGCIFMILGIPCQFQAYEIILQLPGWGYSFDLNFGPMSTLLALAIFGSVAVGSIVVLMWATDGETSYISETSESSPADRSSNKQGAESCEPVVPQPTNEVYRAWWEMVRQVELSDWQSRSPTECASVAIDAGMDPEMVTELTMLFKSVRYGDYPITDDVKQRAAAALDHLQSQPPAGDRGDTDL